MINSVETVQERIQFGIIKGTTKNAPAVLQAPRGVDAHQERMTAVAIIAVPLHSRKYPGLTALVDECDLDLVSQYRWNVQRGRNTFYAVSVTAVNGRTITVRMHRLIASTRPDKFVDHVNGDGLDNTRANLREVSNTQNLRNRYDRKTTKSIFTGVCFNASSAKRPWKAFIGIGGGSPKYLGRYATEVEAALAYDAALDTYGITDRIRNLPGIGNEKSKVEKASKDGFDFSFPEKTL